MSNRNICIHNQQMLQAHVCPLVKELRAAPAGQAPTGKGTYGSIFHQQKVIGKPHLTGIRIGLSYTRMKEKSRSTLLEKVLRHSPDLITVVDQNGIFIEVSSACRHILGYKEDEVVGHHFSEFLFPEDAAGTELAVKQLTEDTKLTSYENRYMHKNGKIVPLSWSAVWSAEDHTWFCVARDISDRVQTELKLRRKEELHRALIEYGSDMLGLLNEQGFYTFAGGSTTKKLGYEPENLIGRSAFDFIHPAELPLAQEAFAQLSVTDAVQVPDFRFLAANGQWHWIEATVSNQLHNPYIQSIVVSARDISERKIKRLALEESEQRFKSLFDNNPDMVLFEDRQGRLLNINKAVEVAFGLQKQEVVNRSLTEFMPAAVVPVCEQSLKNVLEGSPVNFTVELPFAAADNRVLDITKIPVHVGGSIIGVYTIAKDITSATKAHNLIKQQAKTLSTIFESITDAFFTVDPQWKIIYVNSEFDRLLQTNRHEIIGKNFWEVFPEKATSIFYQHYQKALTTGATVQFEAYLSRTNSWLEVKAFPSSEGLSVYFSDITNRINAQVELNKLSVVASKTHNGVIITDKKGVIEWVNESFTQITEYTFEDQYGKNVVALLKNVSDTEGTSKKIVNKLIKAESFEAEVPLLSKSGNLLWIKIGVTPTHDTTGSVYRYIIMVADISQQKQALLERNKFIIELQNRNQSLHQFTHVVSHKIRGPVANILGLASLIKLPDIDTATKEQIISNMGVAAHNLDTIIRDLNHVLSLREPVKLQKECLPLEEVLEETIHLLREQLIETKAAIHLNFSAAPLVYADRGSLRNILYNLLNNALKYRAVDKPLVVEVSSQSACKTTTLCIQDNGLGFDLEKHKEHVFGLYKRFHTHVEGKGLGLFLVKAQVESLGGRIEVESSTGAGSLFKIHLSESN